MYKPQLASSFIVQMIYLESLSRSCLASELVPGSYFLSSMGEWAYHQPIEPSVYWWKLDVFEVSGMSLVAVLIVLFSELEDTAKRRWVNAFVKKVMPAGVGCVPSTGKDRIMIPWSLSVCQPTAIWKAIWPERKDNCSICPIRRFRRRFFSN